ncbi:MAG: ABC transporter permease [Candidatus Caenarcaniphilales bacterium]|nr:ABC transporter permease [Candidatus Caenarcaniphilales bacterium]
MSETVRKPKISFNLVKIYSEIWNYKSFMLNWTQRELELRYKGSVLGVLWSFLNPLLSLIVYFFVFKKLSGAAVPNFLIFLFSGTTAWLFFNQTLGTASNLLIGSSHIMSRVYFPLEILIISNVISQLINYSISFLLVLLTIIFLHAPISWNLLWVPLIALLQSMFLYSAGLLLSSVGAVVRDLGQIVTTALSLLIFATPIFYKAEFVTSNPKILFVMNYQPIAAIISLYRNVIHEATHPDWNVLLYIIVFNLLWYLFCHYIFNKLRGVVYDLI